MTNIATQTSLRDAMYAMSLAKAVPDAELLDEFARRYPLHADALTEFAIELAIDSLMHRSDEEDIPADAGISSVVSRVMSQFEIKEQLEAIWREEPLQSAQRLARWIVRWSAKGFFEVLADPYEPEEDDK